MKRILRQLTMMELTAAALIFLVIPLFADNGRPGPGPRPGGDNSGWFEGNRIVRIQEKLGLTDDQVKKIKAIGESTRKALEPLQKQQADDVKAIREKLNAGGTDADLKPLLEKLEADHKSIADARKAELDQIREILTPIQQAKAVVALSEKMGHWKDGKKFRGHEKEDGPDKQ